MASLEELVNQHQKAIILCMEEVSKLQGTVSALQDVAIILHKRMDNLGKHLQDKGE